MKSKYEITCEIPSSDGWHSWVIEDADGHKIYIEGADEDLVKNIIRDANQKAEGNAAAMREADSIHRAMVLIAGIEMEDSENPPRLWTALEDAYDALSDALGTDGETTADVEEAKATGRHFVVKPYGNAAKMREALEAALPIMRDCPFTHYNTTEVDKVVGEINAALSAPPRNCDRFTTFADALNAWREFDPREAGVFDEWLFAEAKGEKK